MTTADDIEAAAAAWLSRRDRGDWSAQDRAALARWLDEATAHRVAFLRLEAAWDAVGRLAGASPSARRRGGSPRFPASGRAIAAIAACIALMIAGAGVLLSRTPQAIHATEIGHRGDIALQDGSHLDLNTATRLVSVVDQTTREVWLDRGEAYFQIAHDPARPFVVHAGSRTVTVLGTKFAIRNEAGHFRLIVIEGRVRLDDTDTDTDAGVGARPVTLLRGDVATADHTDLLLTRSEAPALKDALAWRDGWIVFDRTTLADAAAEFNRYSTRKLVVVDPAIATIRIGGRFMTGNGTGFARLMQSSLGLKVEYRADAITLSR